MNSRKLVKQTLEFDKPARIPRQLWKLPWAELHYPTELAHIQKDFPDDIVAAPPFYKCPPQVVGNPYAQGFYVDEWGCRFENRQDGVIGEIKEPLLKRWQDVDKIRIPEELLSIDIAKINEFCRRTDQFVHAGCCPRPFERLQFIRGTENVYMDLIDQPNELFVLLNRIHQFYLEKLELWAGTAVDALVFMDDWGSQQDLLVAPPLWRTIFKPFYKDYIDLAHRHGKYAMMHSDGHILKILPDLIDLGLDAINSQIFCMGVEDLGRHFRGKITFWGEIDRQHLLAEGTPGDIARAVRRLQNSLYQGGGIIAQCEFGPGARPENIYEVFKTWDSYPF